MMTGLRPLVLRASPRLAPQLPVYRTQYRTLSVDPSQTTVRPALQLVGLRCHGSAQRTRVCAASATAQVQAVALAPGEAPATSPDSPLGLVDVLSTGSRLITAAQAAWAQVGYMTAATAVWNSATAPAPPGRRRTAGEPQRYCAGTVRARLGHTSAQEFTPHA